MVKKCIAVITLLAFLLFDISCAVHSVSKQPAAELTPQDGGLAIIGVLKKSGEEVKFSESRPARLINETIVGESEGTEGTDFVVKREDVKEVRKNEKGMILEIIMKSGSRYLLGEGTTIYSVKEEPDQFIIQLVRSKTVSIPLSEVDLVWIRRTDPIGSFFATIGGLALVGVGIAVAIALLKTSCPFIYSYDGKGYVFDAEPYGGATSQGLQRTEWCRLEHLKEINGQYKIIIANEVDETQYTDELKLVVVDHPRGVQAAPDETGGIHTIAKPVIPRSARDGRSRDLMPLIRQNDWIFWQSRVDEKNPDDATGLKDDLVFEFPKPAGATQAKLLFNGCNTLWGSQMLKRYLELYGEEVTKYYEAIDSQGPAYDRLLAWNLNEELYKLQIRAGTENGWVSKGTIVGGGPFMSADKVYVLDLRDVPGDVLRIKLTPPAGFWMINYLAVDYTEDAPLQIVDIAPAKAVDSKGQDVREILTASDRTYYVMPNIGDAATITFLAPPEKPGLARTIFCKASGYYQIHLASKGKPQMDVLSRFLAEPGFAVRYALREYQAWVKENSGPIRNE